MINLGHDSRQIHTNLVVGSHEGIRLKETQSVRANDTQLPIESQTPWHRRYYIGSTGLLRLGLGAQVKGDDNASNTAQLTEPHGEVGKLPI
jgi:hypothetical protein